MERERERERNSPLKSNDEIGVSHQAYYETLRDIKGTLYYLHQLYIVCVYIYIDVWIALYKYIPCILALYEFRDSKPGERCRSCSSWIMQPYLYLVSDRVFWETLRDRMNTNTYARHCKTYTHIHTDRLICLWYFLSTCVLDLMPRPRDDQPSSKAIWNDWYRSGCCNEELYSSQLLREAGILVIDDL